MQGVHLAKLVEVTPEWEGGRKGGERDGGREGGRERGTRVRSEGGREDNGIHSDT